MSSWVVEVSPNALNDNDDKEDHCYPFSYHLLLIIAVHRSNIWSLMIILTLLSPKLSFFYGCIFFLFISIFLVSFHSSLFPLLGRFCSRYLFPNSALISATDGAAAIFLPPYTTVEFETPLVIRIAFDWDLWRIVFWQRHGQALFGRIKWASILS